MTAPFASESGYNVANLPIALLSLGAVSKLICESLRFSLTIIRNFRIYFLLLAQKKVAKKRAFSFATKRG